MNKGIVVGGGHSLREYTVSVAKTERDTVIYVSEDLRRACRRARPSRATRHRRERMRKRIRRRPRRRRSAVP